MISGGEMNDVDAEHSSGPLLQQVVERLTSNCVLSRLAHPFVVVADGKMCLSDDAAAAMTSFDLKKLFVLGYAE